MGYLPPTGPRYKTPLWKAILPTLSIAFGILGLLATTRSTSFREVIGSVLIYLAFIIPGAWFFLHERRAKLGSPMPRHWGKLSGAVAAIALTGIFISPEPTPEAASQFSTPLTSTSVTTTKAAPTTKATSTSPAPTTRITTTTTTTTTTTVVNEEFDEDRNNYIDAPDPYLHQTPIPEPTPIAEPEPAPAPVQSTYYANCAQAKAAGAAPLYAGSPGYSTDLDRDGDGVACEN